MEVSNEKRYLLHGDMLGTLRLQVRRDRDLIRLSNVEGNEEAGDTVVCCDLATG